MESNDVNDTNDRVAPAHPARLPRRNGRSSARRMQRRQLEYDASTPLDVQWRSDHQRRPHQPTTESADHHHSARRSAAPTVESDPFTLGVASGDPLADSVILWTRLASGRTAARRPTSRSRGRSPATPTSPTSSPTAPRRRSPPLGHSVHVDANGLDPTPSTGTASPSASSRRPPARTRTRSPRRARCPTGSASRSRRARTGSRAATPPTATWSSRATSTPSCSSATTSTSTRPAATPTSAAADRAGLRVRNGRAVPRALRAVPQRPAAAGGACTRAVDHHLGRPRGRQRLRRRHLRERRRSGSVPSNAAPPPTRSGTSTCRCGSTRRTGPTTRSTDRSPTATWSASMCSTPASTARPAAGRPLRRAARHSGAGPRRGARQRPRPHDARRRPARLADRRRRGVDGGVGRARPTGVHVRRQRARRIRAARRGRRHLGWLRRRPASGARRRGSRGRQPRGAHRRLPLGGRRRPACRSVRHHIARRRVGVHGVEHLVVVLRRRRAVEGLVTGALARRTRS